MPHRTPSRRPPPRVHIVLAMAAAASWGAGCDSLLGEAGLEGTFGVLGDPPDQAAWELRWFLGDGQGLESSCDLAEPLDGDLVFDGDFGSVELPGPDLDQPGPSVQGAGFRWSLALLVLVDADPSSDRPASEADPTAGVWGVAPLHAWLHLDGDIAAFDAALEVLEGEGSPGLRAGFQAVEIFPEDIVVGGTFVGNLASVDPSIVFSEEEGALVVDPLGQVDPFAERLVAGDGLGGLVFGGCP